MGNADKGSLAAVIEYKQSKKAGEVFMNFD